MEAAVASAAVEFNLQFNLPKLMKPLTLLEYLSE